MEDRKAQAQIVALQVRSRLQDVAARGEPAGALADEAAKAAAEAVQSLPDPLRHDTWIYRIVVGGLVLTLIGTVAVMATIRLAAAGSDDVPDALVAIASGALGALTGLLAPAPKNA